MPPVRRGENKEVGEKESSFSIKIYLLAWFRTAHNDIDLHCEKPNKSFPTYTFISTLGT